ncbi:MAM33-mitochondrial acidic matrix protein [Fusarium fujikuroi]|nr:MAM33-mitochondrial acidic matrix protein [Fusarium fujikuroi]
MQHQQRLNLCDVQTVTPFGQEKTARPSAFTKAASALRPAQAAFSTTSFRKATENDGELSAKLESEIKIEEDIKASEQDPASIKDFLNNSAFELIDTPGQEIVKLVRDFGDEKITVSFSIADITNYDPYGEESALEDEGFEDEGAQGSQRNARANEEIDEELEEDAEEENNPPINLSIVVEKPGKASGALNIDASAQEGHIVVENLFYYTDASVAKVLMERFLEERGITQALAVFVPDYVDVKEQREYTRWLNNVKAFIDA